MKKKIYQSPQMNKVEMKAHQMLCASQGSTTEELELQKFDWEDEEF